MTEFQVPGGAGKESGFQAWDLPCHQMRWDIATNPGQLLGTAVANNARTMEYRVPMGGQIIFLVQYQIGTGTGITALSLFPEPQLDLGNFSSVDKPATFLSPSKLLYAAPASYRPAADVGNVTPLSLRYDRIDLPITQLDAGQGNSAGGNNIVSTITFYPAFANLIRFRLAVTGGPGVDTGVVNTSDIIQMFIGRGTLKVGGTSGGTGGH